ALLLAALGGVEALQDVLLAAVEDPLAAGVGVFLLLAERADPVQPHHHAQLALGGVLDGDAHLAALGRRGHGEAHVALPAVVDRQVLAARLDADLAAGHVVGRAGAVLALLAALLLAAVLLAVLLALLLLLLLLVALGALEHVLGLLLLGALADVGALRAAQGIRVAEVT